MRPIRMAIESMALQGEGERRNHHISCVILICSCGLFLLMCAELAITALYVLVEARTSSVDCTNIPGSREPRKDQETRPMGGSKHCRQSC
jgi:hypothetical protein